MTYEEDTLLLNIINEVEEMNLPDDDASHEIMSRLATVYMNLPKRQRNPFFEKLIKTLHPEALI